MVFVLTPLTQSQKIPELAASGTAVDATPPYICPSGKKAQVHVVYQYIAVGANAQTFLMVANKNIRTLVAGDVNKTFIDDFQLNATEDFHFHGNVADNSTLNFTFKALELPV